jgi:hypothetical protein
VRIALRSASAALLALTTVAPVALGQTVPTERVDEYRVKAAILYNLSRFVEWPVDAFPDSAAPLVICVLGTDPFGSALDDAVRGHRAGDRAIVAKRIRDVTPGCHVLFIANSERRRLPTLIEQLRVRRALTVGEAEDFTKQGGMVGLTTKGEQVRFAINLPAAVAAQLKVSARLMALASGPRQSGDAPR